MAMMRRLPEVETDDYTDTFKRDNKAEHNSLLLTARQAAKACGKSLRTWRSWDSGGMIPRAIRIGRSTLWRADELQKWVQAGCPRRAEWEARST
jgi:predicted DNA-binding transcriptional regulator AlpA